MPKLDIRTKSCLVTGAAGGIGAATARRLGGEGARLVLTDVDAVGLAHQVDRLRSDGVQVLAAEPVDVTDEAAVRDFAARVHAEHGPLDLLLNVAGISLWGTVDRLTAEHWRRVIDVDLMGPVHVLSAFLPPMMASGRGGHVVNVASAAALFGLPWHAAYSAAKFGLRGVSEVLRFDLREHGIGVSLVCPGAVATPLVGRLEVVGVDRDAPAVRQVERRFLRHAVTPEQAAEAIVRGVRRRRYWIYTSLDVRLGHWAQRWAPWAYRAAMRHLQRRLTAAARAARRAS